MKCFLFENVGVLTIYIFSLGKLGCYENNVFVIKLPKKFLSWKIGGVRNKLINF